MATREEIREGILTEIKYILKAGDNLTKKAEAECVTDQMLNFLHSQGVMIKVDGKWISRGERVDCIDVHSIDGADKYVAVEPLIKEGE